MLKLEQMVSTNHFRSWEQGPGLATSLEEDSFCFSQAEPKLCFPEFLSPQSTGLAREGEGVFFVYPVCKAEGKLQTFSLCTYKV